MDLYSKEYTNMWVDEQTLTLVDNWEISSYIHMSIYNWSQDLLKEQTLSLPVEQVMPTQDILFLHMSEITLSSSNFKYARSQFYGQYKEANYLRYKDKQFAVSQNDKKYKQYPCFQKNEYALQEVRDKHAKMFMPGTPDLTDELDVPEAVSFQTVQERREKGEGERGRQKEGEGRKEEENKDGKEK